MSAAQELDLTRRPIVQESLAHNAKTLAAIRAPASFLLGLAAGSLSLSSLAGFGLYLAGSLLTSVFIYLYLLEGRPRRYFYAAPKFATSSTATSAPSHKKGAAIAALGEPVALGGHFALAWDVCLGGGVLGVEGIMGFIMAWTLAYNYIGGGV